MSVFKCIWCHSAVQLTVCSSRRPYVRVTAVAIVTNTCSAETTDGKVTPCVAADEINVDLIRQVVEQT